MNALALRPYEPRTDPPNLLEGAFRVHLDKKEIQAHRLSSGDLIRLSTDKGPRGLAVAWFQSKANSKPQARVTDLLRDTYSLGLNEKIFVERADDVEWKPFTSVDLSYVESPGNPRDYASTEEILYWARSALVELEFILPNCTFDVKQRGPRIRPPKLRFEVTSTEPVADLHTAFYFDAITTRISVDGVAEKTTTTEVTAPMEALTICDEKVDEIFEINSDGIGGLSGHIATINQSLTFLTKPEFVLQDTHLIGPTAFLIHGAEGTGKSMLLERISQCSWQETFRLDLTNNPKALAREMTDTFERAREAQPSIVLMDDVDKYLGKAETLVDRLRAELKKLEGTKVVVAATARSVYDIDSSLRTTSAFKLELELFPPNVKQREDILRQIIGPKRPVDNVSFFALAERTHGFVGRDIHKLCGLARNHRVQSIYQSLEPEEKASFGALVQKQDFVSQTDFDAVVDQVQPTVLKDSILEVPKVRWTDIAGLEHVQELLEAIMIRPFKVPDLDIKFGGPQSRKGILLYGPPGCAKTLIAQAVATESKLNFLAVKGSELIKMYVGESERAIRDVFRRARAAKPCIIFFDEIDSIGKSRDKSNDSGLNVVATLLNEMDGIEALKEVFIIGATNRPDILDSALIRTGRFDAHIHIGLPNEDARRQIFEINTRKRPLAGDVDLGVLASQTEGSSGADLTGLCSVAVEMAISDYTLHPENPPEIRMCHFENALAAHVPHTVQEEAERFKNWRPGKSLAAS